MHVSLSFRGEARTERNRGVIIEYEDLPMTKEELEHRQHDVKHKLAVIIMFGHLADHHKKAAKKNAKGILSKVEE